MDTIYFRKLYELVQIPVFAWNGRDRFCLPEGAEYQSPLSEDATLRETAGQAAGRSTGPVLLWEDSEIFYGVLQSGETCIVFGPVSRHALLPEHLAEYCHQHRLTAKQPLRVFAAGAMQRSCPWSSTSLPAPTSPRRPSGRSRTTGRSTAGRPSPMRRSTSSRAPRWSRTTTARRMR